jgi:hypothetical protein
MEAKMLRRLALLGVLVGAMTVNGRSGATPRASSEPPAEQAAQEDLIRHFSLLSNDQYSQAAEL